MKKKTGKYFIYNCGYPAYIELVSRNDSCYYDKTFDKFSDAKRELIRILKEQLEADIAEGKENLKDARKLKASDI